VPQYGARVEYALHTLLNLSFAPTGIAPSARDLAEFQRLPLAFMRKLLTQLEKSGLITGAEGIRGGWRLSRLTPEITMLEIVDAAQGKDPLFECREIRARCALWPDDAPPRGARSGVCEIDAAMLAAERAMREELARLTLADIAARVAAKSSRFVTEDVPAWFAGRFTDRGGRSTDEDRRPAGGAP
jgi:Rrf2 family protein